MVCSLTKESARSIAEECGGLPLAIATMACSLTEVVGVLRAEICFNRANIYSWSSWHEMWCFSNIGV